jgi:hypothetical protein
VITAQVDQNWVIYGADPHDAAGILHAIINYMPSNTERDISSQAKQRSNSSVLAIFADL